MRGIAFSFPLLAACTLSAAAQDPVTIKIAYPKEGQRVRATVEEKTVVKSAFTIGGMPMAKEEVKTKSLVYIDEVIANPQNVKRPDKAKRTYEKAVIGLDGKTTKLPLEGKTVLIEKQGDKYSFTIDGAAVTGESLQLLAEEFNKSDKKDMRNVMFPKTPVKPGGSWKIDPEALAKSIGEDGPTFNQEKIVATGKLGKTYTKDGRLFGELEINFEAPITGLGDKDKLAIKEGKMTIKMSGEGCIDGTAPTGKHTSKVSMSFAGSTMGIEVKAVVDGTETHTVELLSKK